MSRAAPELTTTSYAILGLLAIRSWTSYELAQHMDRSLGRLWPRAKSKLYEEPKKLVALGLAKAEPGSVGKRPRTVYGITAKGRRALRDWLALPAHGPLLEHEQLLKIFFAEHGSRDDVAARIAEMKQWALAERAEHLAVAESYVAGTGAFQQRAAHLLLTGRFLFEFSEMTLRWAEWASGIVEQWPADVSQAHPDQPSYKDVIRRARGG